MSYKVMVVDDSRVVHNQIRHLLEGSDFEVVGECRSGEESLALYESCRPDVVTMDIVMPGEDGFFATRQILEKFPDARILMVSSLAYDDTITEAVEVGAKGFVFKPIEQDQLLHALQDACQSILAPYRASTSSFWTSSFPYKTIRSFSRVSTERPHSFITI